MTARGYPNGERENRVSSPGVKRASNVRRFGKLICTSITGGKSYAYSMRYRPGHDLFFDFLVR
jgi:hypothetical protein